MVSKPSISTNLEISASSLGIWLVFYIALLAGLDGRTMIGMLLFVFSEEPMIVEYHSGTVNHPFQKESVYSCGFIPDFSFRYCTWSSQEEIECVWSPVKNSTEVSSSSWNTFTSTADDPVRIILQVWLFIRILPASCIWLGLCLHNKFHFGTCYIGMKDQ